MLCWVKTKTQWQEITNFKYVHDWRLSPVGLEPRHTLATISFHVTAIWPACNLTLRTCVQSYGGRLACSRHLRCVLVSHASLRSNFAVHTHKPTNTDRALCPAQLLGKPPPARGSADYSGQPKRIRLILTSLCGFALSRLIHPPSVRHKFKATADWLVCQNRGLHVTNRGNSSEDGLRMSMVLERHFAECLPGDTGLRWFKGRYRWANCLTPGIYF